MSIRPTDVSRAKPERVIVDVENRSESPNDDIRASSSMSIPKTIHWLAMHRRLLFANYVPQEICMNYLMLAILHTTSKWCMHIQCCSLLTLRDLQSYSGADIRMPCESCTRHVSAPGKLLGEK